MYAYSQGNRSSRGIERKCREDVAYRVIAANLVPDHSTIAEFRARHEAASGWFVRRRVGAVSGGGTGACRGDRGGRDEGARERVEHGEPDYRQDRGGDPRRRGRIDREEDELYGEKRGDELPVELSTHQGRREWLREAKRRLDEKREREPKPVPRSRPKRLQEAKNRLQEELWAEQHANACYEAWRARGISADGARRMAPGTVKPYVPPEEPAGKVNITDPDSRNLKAFRGYVQGYNAQAVVTEDQIVIAAEIKTDPDRISGHLEPMVAAARRQLQNAGVDQPLGVVVADAGYWHNEQMDQLAARRGGGADPAGLEQTQERPARMERRSLRVDATGARDRGGPRALRETPQGDRARVRADQVQPQDRPVPTTRPRRRTVGMAISSRDAQPPQAPPTPNRRHGGLNGPTATIAARSATDPSDHAVKASRRVHRRQAFTRQPPIVATLQGCPRRARSRQRSRC